ncbi:MAG: hypothetical protein QOJ86_2230, partial [Bradyrhizobium sp.]|nr:hypothetical protein [Bradyrhizobium sp.]
MQASDSNDKIGVYYFYPAGVPTGTSALHAGVFYSTVVLGVRVTKTFDAGPTNQNVSGIDGALEVAKELTGIRDPATPYGKMKVTPDTIQGADSPSGEIPLPGGIVGGTILASGFDLSQNWGAIKTTFEQAGSGLYYYFPWLQNSNTVAMTALSNGGITWAPLYPDTAIYSVPSGIGQGSGGRPTIMQPFSPETGPDNVELFFPGANKQLSTNLTPSVPNGVPFEQDGYIYTFTRDASGRQLIKAEPTEATLALRGELAAYNASVDEVNKLIEETWVKPNGETVDRKFQYSGDDPSPNDVTTTESRNGSPTAQEQDFPASKLLKYYDTQNYHPYSKLEVSEGPDGEVTAAQVTLDPAVLAAGMSIGQIFGSALGGALGGNSLVGNLAGSTIGGLVGQKFVQVLATAMTTDLSTVSLSDVFASQGISVANAGIGAVSSFLTAELGHALHINGFDGQLFNTAVSSFTTSLLTQVTDKMARGGLDFAGAIAAMDWTQAVSGAIDVAQINLGNLLGSYLGHELVPAQTREGAIGGQVFGAIGGFILGPVGSLIGTIIGTLIFNQFGTQPSPGAVDLLEQAGYLYGHREYQTSPDGGSYDISNKMAQAADDIINAYLHAVNGAALDHSKQATIGYIKNPDLLFISGVPGHTDRSFTSADDAVHAAALDVLQHTEVIGGDLLMKRAHQNSLSNVPETGGGGLPGQSQVSGADQLATMAGDISVAQDYENYLDNREAINALIAANPNSAFAAGWIATFARVNELGLNHMGASDFLGGLVGYLDSVNKAGLGAEAANATVKQGSGSSMIVELLVGNGVEVPGALSVFADSTSVSSDASGQTVQFVFNGGLGAAGFHGFGAAGTAGHDILVGGAADDTFHGGAGFDFIDGGAGNDTLYGEDGNDILRGGRGVDYLFGGAGDDTYVFNRGDGADVVLDDVTTTTSVWQDEWRDDDGDGVNELHHDLVTKTDHPNAGTDSLVFGPGIARSDIVVQRSGNDLIVGVKDPAHPGAVNDQITLQRWFDADGFDRIEKFVFADGTTLNLSAGQAAIDARQVPFGETLSRSSVVEKSPIGTVVGTVTGFDF